MSPAATLLLLHAEMFRAGGENWILFGHAARDIAGRIISGEA